LRASAYQAFRAPTLNELYRPFQVGTVRTEANENLGPETLRGAEAGIEVGFPREWSVRATGFWNLLDNPVTNVTLAPNSQQRQNLGQARIRGADLDARWRLHPSWVAGAGATFVDARVTDAGAQTQLVSKQLPQDPRFRAVLSLAFEDRRILTAQGQLRFQGRQFEDDQNLLPLASFVVVDLLLSRRLSDRVEIVVAAENLFDRRYLVGRQGGIDTLGQPLFVHGGVRVQLE
jgi:outer membrane receptor protein involved in Fe transport